MLYQYIIIHYLQIINVIYSVLYEKIYSLVFRFLGFLEWLFALQIGQTGAFLWILFVHDVQIFIGGPAFDLLVVMCGNIEVAGKLPGECKE